MVSPQLVCHLVNSIFIFILFAFNERCPYLILQQKSQIAAGKEHIPSIGSILKNHPSNLRNFCWIQFITSFSLYYTIFM